MTLSKHILFINNFLSTIPRDLKPHIESKLVHQFQCIKPCKLTAKPFHPSFIFTTFAKIIIMTFNIVIVGYLAGFCTAIAQFPQAYKVIRTRETSSISLGMYIIMTLGIFFWFMYGVLIPDLPMILANFVCLIPSVYILFITIRNSNRLKKHIQ